MKKDSPRLSGLFDFYAPLLTQKQQEFFIMYHNEDLSLSEIAENEGLSRQGARDAIVRAETVLCELEEKLGHRAKIMGLQETLAQIKPEAEVILFVNERRGGASEIDGCASRIAALCDEAVSV